MINVPGGSVDGFVKTAAKYKEKSSILNNLFAQSLPKNIKPKRVALISFSHGWSWSTQVLRCKKDISRIDSVIVMDGINTPSLKAWNDYAKLASEGGNNSPKLWMAHTQVKPEKGPSTKNTNAKIIKSCQVDSNTNIKVPNHIAKLKLDKPIKVYCNAVKPHHKIYMKDSLINTDIVGNVVRCEYEGSMPQDLTYNSQYVQPRFWEWLRQVWEKDAGVKY